MMKYELTTEIAGELIKQELKLHDEKGIGNALNAHAVSLSRWVINTREQSIHDALIKLGWIPPNGKNDLIKQGWTPPPRQQQTIGEQEHRTMRQGIVSKHTNDANGNPAGGTTTGTGISIGWQNGPLGRHAAGCEEGKPCVEGCTRVAPNGAFVEDVIEAAADRLRYYQGSRFACETNAEALDHLEKALAALDRRTKDRESRKVEGTHGA